MRTNTLSGTKARLKPSDAVQVHMASAGAFNGYLHLSPWVKPNRDYLLIEPQSDSPRRPTRLLLLLHGCGQSADEFLRGTGALRLAREHHWLVLLMAQSRIANTRRCWNWFDGSTRYGGGEVAIAVRAVQAVASQFGISTAQTFIAGMSSGAALAAAICAHHPGLFAGAMYHSGLAYRASESAIGARRVLNDGPVGDVTLRIDPAQSPSTLIIHGDADRVVAPSHADELMRQTLAQDGKIRPGEPLPDPDRIARQHLSDREVTRATFGRHQMMTIAGLQHAWTGSEEDLPYFDRLGPSALALANAFFSNTASTSCW